MAITSQYSLQHTMVVYFLLIGIAALFVGVEFVMDTHSVALREDLLENFEQYTRHEIDAEAIFDPINKLRNKAIAMVSVILFVVLVVLTMFIKHITEPLQHMIIIARKIAGGDLSHTITIESRNELMELGDVINEMSSNLQEILLLTKQFCLSGNTSITNIKQFLDQNDLSPKARNTIQKELDHLQEDLTKLAVILDYFNFYTLVSSDDN